MGKDVKMERVFDAATTVFSNYGFKRTSMNDIANSAGISRPALYLMFENKEDIFRQLATYRQNQAIDEAETELSASSPIDDRIVSAILAYERIYYEPIAASPHGAEFMDINLSVAQKDMENGRKRLVKILSDGINQAIASGELELRHGPSKAAEFVELLLASIGGIKKSAQSLKEFRTKVKQTAQLFMSAITVGKV